MNLKKLSTTLAHLRSRDDCISFDSAVQEEHNSAILEALSLLCEKLLAQTSFDISLPYLTPRLCKYVHQTNTNLVTYC